MRLFVIGLLALMVFARPGPAAADAQFDADLAILTACLADNAGKGAEQAAPCVGLVSEPCIGKAIGGEALDIAVACHERETALWDHLLNLVYDDFRQDTAPDVFTALRDAQRAWIAFRDADCAFPRAAFYDFPEGRPVASACLQAHTARRVGELRHFFDVTPKG